MSTRSGKRIHASVDSPVVNTDIILESERKVRSKKPKDNVEPSTKKRHNYVSYPIAEDNANISSNATEDQLKPRKTRKTLRNTSKEHSGVSDVLEPTSANKSVRKSHRVKKVIEEQLENTENIVKIQNYEMSESSKDKKKHKKKKKNKKHSEEIADLQDIEGQVIKRKDTKKDRLNSFVVNEPKTDTVNGCALLNSFHSAAGSPVNSKLNKSVNQTELPLSFHGYEVGENISMTLNKSGETLTTLKSTVDVLIKNKRNSDIQNFTLDKMEIKDVDKENICIHFDKSPDLSVTSNARITKLAKKKNKKSNIDSTALERNETRKANEDNCNTIFDKSANVQTDLNTTVDMPIGNRKRRSIQKCSTDNIETNDVGDYHNTTFDVVNDVLIKKKRKSSITNKTLDKIARNNDEVMDENNFDLSFDRSIVTNKSLSSGHLKENNKKLNTSATKTVSKDTDKPNNFNHVDTVSYAAMYDTRSSTRKSNVIHSIFDNVEKHLDDNKIKHINDIPNENDTGTQVSYLINESLQEKDLQSNKIPDFSEQILPSCVEKVSMGISKSPEMQKLNMTFDPDNNNELNVTYENEKKPEIDFKKVSLTHSDAAINVTYDKLEDNSHISITSDESTTEDILNHTPALIESSIDESLMLENKIPEKSAVLVTPLKRDSTFIKEISDILTSPKCKSSAEMTSVKRKSSPGCTPFPYSKSSQKENSKLNVTRSIEKSLRHSSLLEVRPRQTKVMFCSPVNNPAVVTEMNGRVIKSNLKGSNKSFVFENSVVSNARACRRKRSLTEGALGAAGDAATRVKRKRLGDELQLSVDRLSRPRTQSAAGKLPDPGTPLKKCGTPVKAKAENKLSRTKLPNFAAMHQKQFAKMESLDECQQRKARRARQLLTPTGSVGLLERISPKGTSPMAVPSTKEPVLKLQTPSKSKLPTLESLIPGYTRFGFKLNMDGNPFSIAGKTEIRKGHQPNGLSTTCLALPSLAGSTATRRDVAKQTVMREKSFSEKRDAKRKETRTVIKGVRTNRRFELQMKLRNINA